MKKVLTLLAVILLAGTLCACGERSEATLSADLDALYEQLLGSAEDLPEMVAVPESKISKLFGLEPEDCNQLVISLCSESVRADEIWMIEAKDDSAADRAEALAEARLEQRRDEMKNYLPDQYAVLQQAKLVRRGRFVALFVSPEAADMADMFLNALGG